MLMISKTIFIKNNVIVNPNKSNKLKFFLPNHDKELNQLLFINIENSIKKDKK